MTNEEKRARQQAEFKRLSKEIEVEIQKHRNRMLEMCAAAAAGNFWRRFGNGWPEGLR